MVKSVNSSRPSLFIICVILLQCLTFWWETGVFTIIFQVYFYFPLPWEDEKLLWKLTPEYCGYDIRRHIQELRPKFLVAKNLTICNNFLSITAHNCYIYYHCYYYYYHNYGSSKSKSLIEGISHTLEEGNTCRLL